MNTIWEVTKRAWKGWKRVSHEIGNFQGRVLLTILYAVALWPFGIAVRLIADPLRIKRRPARWLERQQETHDLEWARRQ
jgi:hypothetical protein